MTTRETKRDEGRAEALRARLTGIIGAEQALARERYEVTLAIEEVEGRPDSHEARFARAFLAGDGATMTRLCAEDTAKEYRTTGKWCAYQSEAERILAAAEVQP